MSTCSHYKHNVLFTSSFVTMSFCCYVTSVNQALASFLLREPLGKQTLMSCDWFHFHPNNSSDISLLVCLFVCFLHNIAVRNNKSQQNWFWCDSEHDYIITCFDRKWDCVTLDRLKKINLQPILLITALLPCKLEFWRSEISKLALL